MPEQLNNIKEEVEILKSDDSVAKRELCTKYLDVLLPDEVAEAMAANLLDHDIGVRDSVSQTLIYNANEKVPYLLIPYTTSKEEISTRNLAGEILLKRGKSSIPAMANFLDEGDDDDKKFLIDLMGLIGEIDPELDIRKVLRESHNDNVILACIEALGNIRSASAVQDITDKYEVSELFKPTIIEALGNIGSEEAVPFILEYYPKEDMLTRFSMIESLGMIGNGEAFFHLLSELPNISGPLTWASILSLKMLKDKLGIDVPYDESMKNSLLSTLLQGELKHKKAAAELITAFSDKDIIQACLKNYGIDEDIDSKIKEKFLDNPLSLYPRLTEYLKTIPNNLRNLIELLTEIISNDGGESIQQLSPLELRNLCDLLTVCIENVDEEVRRVSIELLFYLDYNAALMFVDTMTQDDNYWNKLRLAEILENFDDERATEGLKILADDPEDMVREKAQEILSQRN